MEPCSFCNRPADKIKTVINSTKDENIAICNNCLKAAMQQLANDINETEYQDELFDIPTPSEIKKYLDDYVIGQDETKKILSTAVYNHYKRVFSNDNTIQKSNVLLIGPSGCGKTFLAKTIAKLLNVPFAIADATSITEAGYVGDDVENMLTRALQNANGDVARAEKSIIVIDELDKIARKSENRSITRDVSGEGVQMALLKIIEGTISNVSPTGGRRNPAQQYIQMDTSNILFICCGAFDGIKDIVEKRLNKDKTGIGFTSTTTTIENDIYEVTPEDLQQYGFIPELIGRIPIISKLNDLDEQALVDILSKPKDCLVQQYQKLFALDGCLLTFTDEALLYIARTALERKLGARGLRSIMEVVLQELMFTIPDEITEKIEITEEYVIERLNPVKEA